MLALVLGYSKSTKTFDIDLFEKKKDKTIPDALSKLVRSCTNDDITRRPTFSAIAKYLVKFHNQEYRMVMPLVDEEASIAMDVATAGHVNLKRSWTKGKVKHRSVELCVPPASLNPTPMTASGRIASIRSQDVKKMLLSPFQL